MKSVIVLATLLFSTVALADKSGPILADKVSFRGTLVDVKIDLGTNAFSIGTLHFNDAQVSVEKNNLLFSGVKGKNISAILYVQNAGQSTDFGCPGVNIQGITNARVLLTSTDAKGKQTLLNDNCVFLKEVKN